MQYVSSLYHKFLYLENLFILIVLSVRGLTQIFSFQDTVNKPKTTTTEQELLDLTNEVRKTFFNNSTSILSAVQHARVWYDKEFPEFCNMMLDKMNAD